jgi:predicted nucleic acid-binding Zn ribbon protein
VRSLRCENREHCLTAYRNIDFAPLAQTTLTCPECGSPLVEPRQFKSRKQTILFGIQILLLVAGVLSFVYLKQEAIDLYQRVKALLQ